MASSSRASRSYGSRPYTGDSVSRTGFSSITRPQTSRPATARPVTAASARQESSFIIAVIEGRGVAREVGLACLNKDTGRVVLVQLADSQTYVKTLYQMHINTPSLILVPDTFIAVADTVSGSSGKKPSATSVLVECIQDEFPDVPVDPVLRKFWNNAAGMEFISQLCVQDEERAGTIIAMNDKYYALCAASALFKYAELRLNMTFAPNSLRIKFASVEGTMMIDIDTIRNLEIVGNMTYKKSSHSLFGVLNHTYTAMAGRLLRASLIAPITAQSALDARLDVVDEFVKSEDRHTMVKSALKQLHKADFDKLIASLAASETRETSTARTAASRISDMLNLRNVVKSLPALRSALEGSHSQLLQLICQMLSDERLGRIEALVRRSLNEEAMPSKGGLAGVNARVYAVKADCNPLLDVARETFKENVIDIQTLHRTLCETHGLPILLPYQGNGFVFAIKKEDLEAHEGGVPRGFINVSTQKGRRIFTSIELKKRNARMKDALDEALLLSYTTIQGLVSQILLDVGALYKASEAVALVDMLWSFAHVSILRNYVRPEFTGTLAIRAGRHPILESVQQSGTLVPNDVYASDSSSFQIIHGPNMSGKSTYLRQVGLLTVMAMSGSFVPAEYASFRIHDALLTRLSNDDDMEKSLSTFAAEMAAAAMVLGLATPRSLVLVDELGRGTAPAEGVGISHAIAEAMIGINCFVFFATHFRELATTLSRQPTVVNLHLAVHSAPPTSTSLGIAYRHKVADGVPPEELGHYGLELARLADLPPDVLTEASRVAHQLDALEAAQNRDSAARRLAARRKALVTTRDKLRQVRAHAALPPRELAVFLAEAQAALVGALHANL